MRQRRAILTLVVLSLWAGACASTGDPASRPDRNVVTADQLQGMERLSLYEALQRVKPLWLRSARGADSFGAPQGRRGLRVYLNGSFYGGVADLQGIRAQNVEEVRYLDKRKATLRFGTDHSEGALLVSTLSGR